MSLLRKSSSSRFLLAIVVASSFAFDWPLTAYSASDCFDGIGGMISTGYNPVKAWCSERKDEYRLRVSWVFASATAFA